MKIDMLQLVAHLLICSVLTSCDRLEDPSEYLPIKDENSPISGIYIKKIADGIDNSYIMDDSPLNGQGFAVHGKTAYRLYDTGICQTYDFSNIESPIKLSSFPLGSSITKNHSNCAQFGGEMDGKPLLYVSGLSGKCFVEKVDPEGSECVQTLTLLAMESYNISKSMNIICGDDGYIWAFGDALSSNALTFAKLRKPDVSEGDITFSGEDVLDYWTEEGYIYTESVWQGGMVYEGFLYYVFGTPWTHRHIVIYNTETHEKVSDIDLDAVVYEEPEDCEMVDGQIILALARGTGYYIIDLEQRAK